MNYREWKDFVMQLIGQYSACGVELTGDYNDQEDFFLRLPGLYNAAMLEMASDASPLIAIMKPKKTEITQMKGFISVKVPKDFLKMTGDGLPKIDREGRMTREKGYYMVGVDRVMIREDLFGVCNLEYCRMPVRLPASPEDDTPLDGTVEMQMAAAYYAGAMLMMQEDAFSYAALRNEYDDKVSAMKRRMHAERFFVVPEVDVGYNVY